MQPIFMLSADFPTLSAPSSPSCVVDVISPTTYCGPAPPHPKAPLRGCHKFGTTSPSRRSAEPPPLKGEALDFRTAMASPMRGSCRRKATDEVDNVSSTQLPPPHPSRLPPCHLPLIGEGFLPTSPHAKIPRRLHPNIKKSPSHPGGRT